MLKFILVSILCIFLLSAHAQEYSISLLVKGFPEQEIILTRVEGDMYIIQDTLVSNKLGQFSTAFSAKNTPGIYKFIFPQFQNAEVPFIFNYESISLSTHLGGFEKSVQVLNSQENKAYYSFLQFNSTFTENIEVLEYVYSNYNDKGFIEQSKDEYERLIMEQNEYLLFLENTYKNTFAYHVIKSSIPPLPTHLVNQTEKQTFLKSNHFKNIDFTDTTLFKTQIFPDACVQYLSLFTNDITPSNKREIFKQAIDTILLKARVNPVTFDFVVNYILDGFQSMGDDNLVQYISEAYLQENSCENSNAKTTIERKALSNITLAVGKEIPDFSISSFSGNTYSKSSVSNRTTVLIFWATWCSHCVEMVPKIMSAYDYNKNKIDVITIALDTNKQQVLDFIQRTPNMSEENTACDLKSWDGEVAQSFLVYATPTIFIIQNNMIVAKPIEVEAYLKELSKLAK